MSSLMQFDGETGRRGVLLQFTYPTEHMAQPDGSYRWVMREPIPCSRCGKAHEQVHVAWRRPVGMLGCWVTFRYNGKIHAPDLSLPIDVERLPRDARPLSAEENSALWHRA